MEAVAGSTDDDDDDNGFERGIATCDDQKCGRGVLADEASLVINKSNEAIQAGPRDRVERSSRNVIGRLRTFIATNSESYVLARTFAAVITRSAGPISCDSSLTMADFNLPRHTLDLPSVPAYFEFVP